MSCFNIKFVLGWLGLFVMFSSAWSQEEIPATPLPRKDRLVTLAPLHQARLDITKPGKTVHTTALSDRAFVAGVLQWDGNRVIGKITVHTNAAIPQPAVVTIQAWNSEANGYVAVKLDTLTANGSSEIDVDGVYTHAIRVLVDPNQSATFSISSITAEEIVLATTARIMLIGDSITEGRGSDDGLGYRKMLYDKLKAVNAAVDFVGSYGDPPYEGHFQGSRKTFDFYPASLNHGGTGLMDVTSDMDVYRPTMVAVHLGTNGFTTNVDQMTTLIKYLLTWHSGKGNYLQQVVVSQIVPMKGNDSSVVVFNTKLANMVHAFQKGFITGQAEPVYLCDHYTRFVEYPYLYATDSRTLMADNLHPNGNGYQMMAATYNDILAPIMTATPRWFSSAEWQVGAAGLDHLYGGQGLALADINNDGKDEWYLSRIAPTSTVNRHAFYFTNDSLRWLESAEAMQAQDGGNSRGSVFLDMDNDGDLDLFNAHSPGQNRLLENVTNSYFRDVTIQNGIEANSEETSGVAALDVERDGDLDLFVLNMRATNELYINDGKGKFSRKDRGCNDIYESNSDVTRLAVAAADFDNDGDVDLYVVKRNSANRLYVNNGSGTFVDRASEAGVNLAHKANGAYWADLDNDGDLDLIVTVSAITGESEPLLRLFQNKGDGTFQNMTAAVAIPMAGYSVCLADFDKDGRQDIVTTSEYNSGAFFRNEANWQFRKISDTGAEVNAGDTRAATALDMDNDGDMDFLLHRADAFDVLKKNNLTNGLHYLKVKAAGPKGNSVGIGTKVWIYQSNELGNAAALLGYRELLSANGHLTSPSPTLHFGLNSQTYCDLLAQFTDGTILTMRNLGADQTITIKPEKTQSSYGAPTTVLKQSGDQQVGVVGQQLTDPITVKVVDSQNRAVPNIKVDFALKSGDAQLIQPTVTTGAQWLEPELGKLSGRMRWAYDTASSGSGIVLLASQGTGSGSDTLTVQTAQAIVYYAWLRAFNPNAATATVRLQMDQQSKASMAISELNGWQWLRVSANGSDVSYSLAAGSHRLLLEWDQGALQLDRILLTPDANYIPAGLGEQGNADPLRTDQNGVTWRRVQLGSKSGPVTIEARASDYSALSAVLFQAQANPGKAAALAYVSGNNQTAGKKGTPLAAPFVVASRDAFGNAVANKLVRFKVVSGGGTLAPADGRVLTDQNGQAAALLTLGGLASSQRVTAEADSVTGSPVTFEASVTGLATEMRMTAWVPPVDTVLNVIETPLQIVVLNDSGNPVAAYPVVFRAHQGGKVSAEKSAMTDTTLTLYTNSAGAVQAWWKLGSISGEHSLTVDANGIKGSPASLKATALAGPPALIFAAGGDQQSGTVGTRLKLPFQIRITDSNRNPVARQSVLFKVTAGDGFLNGTKQVTVLSDSSGLASAYLTLGTKAGQMSQTVQASAAFTNTTVSFLASALAGPATTLLNISASQLTALIGSVLSPPLQVRVHDQYQNAVAGFNVEFQVSKGNGFFDNNTTSVTASTDAQGVASVAYHVGTAAGVNSQQITAKANGLNPGSLVFTITTLANRPSMLTTATGSGQFGAAYSRLAEPFTITVTDNFGNAIFGHPVQFTVVSASGTLQGERTTSAITDSSGVARAYLILAGDRGDSVYVVEASSEFEGAALTNSPTRFYASSLSATPVRLFPITNPNQLLEGFAYHELDNPVSVQVIDEAGRGVPGVLVEFNRTKGTGYFAPTNKSTVAVYTNSEGMAGARFVLGAPGLENGFTASAYNGTIPLGNSPIAYSALAHASTYTLQLLSSDRPSGIVGTSLPEAIKIKITDMNGNAAVNRNVRFRIAKGQGVFVANGDTVLSMQTTTDGTAAAVWRLGNRSGRTTQLVTISALDDGSNPMAGSPLSIYANALADKPDASQSSLTAISPVFTGAGNGSAVTVVVKDKYGNLVADRQITFVSSGLTVSIDPTQIATDSLGTGKTTVRATAGGDATIQAQDVLTRTMLGAVAPIHFNDLVAASITAVGNSERTAVAGDTLAEPLQVLVRDATGKGLAQSAVQFALVKGEANFLSGGNVVDYRVSSDATKLVDVLTDASGLARVKLLMGTKSGVVHVVASSKTNAGLKVQFAIQVQAGSPAMLQKISGDQQTGTTGHRLNQPLIVRLFDAYGNPIPSHSITLHSSTAGARFLPSGQVITDSTGKAQVLWILGKETGLQQAVATAGALTQTVLFVAEAGANSAPVLSLQDSYSLTEGTLFSLLFTAYDAEMDTVFLSASPLPKGATLQGTLFSWKPGFDQAGDYAVEFIARDSVGAVSRKSVLLQVANVNQRPAISNQGTAPVERNLSLKKPSGYIDFAVNATDGDADPLFYSWTVNGVFKSALSQFRFQSDLYSAGLNTIKAIVSDGRDTTSVTWRVQITTAVVLNSFSGAFAPFAGTTLSWSTRYETENIGFYVWRSGWAEGPFEKVSPLVPFSSEGQYAFTDAGSVDADGFYYRLQDVSRDGRLTDHEVVFVAVPLPTEFHMAQNYPNPFNSSTTLAFTVPADESIQLNIFDVSGRLVRTLLHEELKPGYYVRSWDGLDANDRQVASGTYYGVLSSRTVRLSKKMILLR